MIFRKKWNKLATGGKVGRNFFISTQWKRDLEIYQTSAESNHFGFLVFRIKCMSSSKNSCLPNSASAKAYSGPTCTRVQRPKASKILVLQNIGFFQDTLWLMVASPKSPPLKFVKHDSSELLDRNFSNKFHTWVFSLIYIPVSRYHFPHHNSNRYWWFVYLPKKPSRTKSAFFNIVLKSGAGGGKLIAQLDDFCYWCRSSFHNPDNREI